MLIVEHQLKTVESCQAIIAQVADPAATAAATFPMID